VEGLKTLLNEYDVIAAFWMTIKLTVISAVGALVIGSLIAVMRVSPIGFSIASRAAPTRS